MSISYHKNGLVGSHQTVGRWFIFMSVAILELKKWGDHCGAKEKVGGATNMSSCMVIFRFFEDYVAMIYPIKPNMGL